MHSKRDKYIFWICFLFLVCLLLFSPRGCSSFKAAVGPEMTGSSLFEIQVDPSYFQKTKIIPVGQIGSESFQKRDYLFVAFYEQSLKVDLSIIPRTSAPFSVAVTAPGSIVSTNCDRVERHTAVWTVYAGKSYEMKVTTREIRWHLIVLTILAITFLIYLYPYREKQSAL